MIKNYKDHAANERTYLAWIRTGVTIMMLGFFIEKFELFLATIANNLPGKTSQLGQLLKISHMSIALVILAIFIIATATLRYFRIRRELDMDETLRFRGTLFATAVSIVMLVFAFYVLTHLSGFL
jgi:putative membrane protein